MRFGMLALAMAMVTIAATQEYSTNGGISGDVLFKTILAPSESRSTAHSLIAAGEFRRAKSVVDVALTKYPLDFNLRQTGAAAAFLLEDYGAVMTYLTYTDQDLASTSSLDGLMMGTAEDCYRTVAVHRGAKGDSERLDNAIRSIACKMKDQLPSGMVVDDELIASPEIVAWTVLLGVHPTHRPLLLSRMQKIAPKDTFVFELCGDEAARKRNFELEIRMLVEARKECSKERRNELGAKLENAKKNADIEKKVKELRGG